MKITTSYWLILFVIVTFALTFLFAQQLRSDDQRTFMPAPVSYAHHQIELACKQCHDGAFSGTEAIEKRCRDCHQEALQAMHDAHGKKKFFDPRNADWLAILDARQCLTCHDEHAPERTGAMALTQPNDFCSACHATITQERDSHRDVAANSCLAAGCHNYHDASTLHETFLSAQLTITDAQRPHQRLSRSFKSRQSLTPDRSNNGEISAPTWNRVVTEWSRSQHANSEGNCSDCHQTANDWSVNATACQQCHQTNTEQFAQGHHGMRAAAQLPPLSITQARLPMNTQHGDKIVNCNACHRAHNYQTKTAEAEACLACHNDEHSLAWRESSHAKKWLSNADQGASCATCHMPRVHDDNDKRTLVQHNQSANLRPNDKMLKTVCLACHDINTAMSALADPAQIRSNFQQPAGTHRSLDWVRQRQHQTSTIKGTTP